MKSRVVSMVMAGLLLSGSSFAVSITFSVKLSSVLPPGEFAEVQADRTGRDDMPLEKDSTIWRGTFDFEPTRFLLYRFWVVTPLVDTGEGDPGRVVYMTNDLIALPLAHFNVLLDSFQNTVTFQIDMREAIATGRFDPTAERIGLSGPLVDDDPYFRVDFRKKLSVPGVYQATVPILTALPGDKVTYNYTLSLHDAETIPPRTFVLQGGAQVLPIDYFDEPAAAAGNRFIGRSIVYRASAGAECYDYVERSGGRPPAKRRRIGRSVVHRERDGRDRLGHAARDRCSELFSVGNRFLNGRVLAVINPKIPPSRAQYSRLLSRSALTVTRMFMSWVRSSK